MLSVRINQFSYFRTIILHDIKLIDALDIIS